MKSSKLYFNACLCFQLFQIIHVRILKVSLEGVGHDNVFIFLVEKRRVECHYKGAASETPFKWRFAGVPTMTRHWMLVW